MRVVVRIRQLRLIFDRTVVHAAVLRNRHATVTGTVTRAGVEHHTAIRQLHDLVLIHQHARHRVAGLPGLAMVVGVHGYRGVRTGRTAHGILLNQTTLVLAVLELDAGTGGGETGLPLVLVTLGDVSGDVTRLAPRLAVVL